MARLRIACFVLLIDLDFRLCIEFVERRTEYGSIRGFVKDTIPGKSVEMFLGVPYASPPIGNLRYEYPKPPKQWTGPLDTLDLPPACPQHFQDLDYLQIHSPGFNKTGEDCLYVNIYVPRREQSAEPLSTFVWIHGGSNEYGMGAMLTGEVLAAYTDIIVINFNYRLGNLGFLHLDNTHLPGNLGLVDQMEAIRWVNRNIHLFDGDPTKVTLAGHSAGAADVGVHLLNPNLKGLFRHAIIMSGSPLSYWAIMNDKVKPVYTKKVQIYLESVGCLFGDPERVKLCLQTKKVPELTKYLRITVPQMLVHPMVVDNVTLFDYPITLLEEGQVPSIPVMLGFTKDEGAMIAEANPNYPWMLYDYKELKKTIRGYRKVMSFSKRFEEIVAHEYMNYSLEEEYEACTQAYVEIESDTSIKVPVLHLARLIQNATDRQNKSSKVFLYSYEYENENTFQSVFYQVFGKPAIPHGQDLFYIFGIPLIGHARYNFTGVDVKLSKHMMRLWAKFVKTGDLSKSRSEEDTEPYPSFEKETNAYIKISNDNPQQNPGILHDNPQQNPGILHDNPQQNPGILHDNLQQNQGISNDNPHQTLPGYQIQSSQPYNMRAYDFWTRVELLFLDWSEDDCNSSESLTFDLTCLFLIILYLI